MGQETNTTTNEEPKAVVLSTGIKENPDVEQEVQDAQRQPENEEVKKKKIRSGNRSRLKDSIYRRVMTALLLMMGVMAVSITIISAYSVRRIYYRQYTSKAQDLVRMLAHEIDGDWLKGFSQTYEKDEQYEKLQQVLDQIKGDFTELQYLYIYKPEDTYFTYLAEAHSAQEDEDMYSRPGDIYEYNSSDYVYLVPDIQNQRASTDVILGQDAGYGRPISAWAPIFDTDGDMVAMVEADYIIENIGKQISVSIALIVAVQLLCICIVVVLMIQYIRRNIVEPIFDLKKMVDAYDSGDITTDVSRFKHDDEIRSLACAFRDMTHRIVQYIHELTTVTAEKERIGAELNVATQIQADMLPGIFPAFPDRSEFELYATMEPAKEVGGDFYDFFMIDQDHLGLVIADVSGKGVPAALFMVIAKTLIKNRAMTGGYSGPAEVLESVNDQLCEGNDADLFVTVWFGILTISTGQITFASAGHEYPAFCRNDGGFVVEKNKPSLPLATFEGIKMQDHVTYLKKGETLYLYTDGITEATNIDKELFGEERMLKSLRAHADEDIQLLLKNVRKDIDMFVGDAPQFDDMTMLAIRYVG